MSEPMVTHMQTHGIGRVTPPAGTEVSLRQVAYDRIEELLNWGMVRPGQIISQRELVEMAGVTVRARSDSAVRGRGFVADPAAAGADGAQP